MKVKSLHARHGQARRLLLRQDPARVEGLAAGVAAVMKGLACVPGACAIAHSLAPIRGSQLAKTVDDVPAAGLVGLAAFSGVEVTHNDGVYLRQAQGPHNGNGKGF